MIDGRVSPVSKPLAGPSSVSPTAPRMLLPKKGGPGKGIEGMALTKGGQNYGVKQAGGVKKAGGSTMGSNVASAGAGAVGSAGAGGGAGHAVRAVAGAVGGAIGSVVNSLAGAPSQGVVHQGLLPASGTAKIRPATTIAGGGRRLGMEYNTDYGQTADSAERNVPTE